ncbi:hypothetical protein BH20ACI3_BH20ACI3_38070 [soil metagenome]
MSQRIAIIVLVVLLYCAACFGQRPFLGLTAGTSTRADAERVLGQPVKKISETLYEYAPQKVKTNRQINCGQIYVQYRKQSAVIERIEVQCESGCIDILIQPFEAVIRKTPAPEATTSEGKGTDKEKQIEFFGKPYWAVQTVQLKNGGIGCRMGFYSLELYQVALPK